MTISSSRGTTISSSNCTAKPSELASTFSFLAINGNSGSDGGSGLFLGRSLKDLMLRTPTLAKIW